MGRTDAVLIVNPRSAAGATARKLPLIRQLADRHFDKWEIRKTEAPGHAASLAAEAIEEGWSTIVAVGGDGTTHEVVNGFFTPEGETRGDALLAMIPAGTGSDLIKTLRIPTALEAAVGMVGQGATTHIDVAWCTFVGTDGQPRSEAFVNVAGFGANGEVVRLANQGSKRFGGMPTFLQATLRAIASYRPEEVRLRYTDAQGDTGEWQGKLMAAFLANGRYAGGGMLVGPDATLEDGLVDLTVIPEMPALTLARHLPKLYTGKLGRVSEVLTLKVSTLEVEPVGRAEIRLDLDGEDPGICPLSVRVLRKVVRVRVGADYSG